MSNTASITGHRIKVTACADGWFAGDVRVVTEKPWRPRRKQPAPEWPKPLNTETKIALGLDEYCNTVRLHDCRVCGALFIAHYTAHLCSPACVTAARAQRARAAHAWREANFPRPPSKAAHRRATLAGAKCLVCGEPFKPARLSARFCSNRCRQKHHRQTAEIASARAAPDDRAASNSVR
jgi:predicted nucleic acid-binding Zn ribbon protein